ncbi:MAG: sugar ABC transporter permease [Anaerolineaceae bacterium]|nr:sugar ABC transporter permease [Anaerolineaceae bacterium]MCY3907130.1 sugar ABC transporter permease [Anaerolineaceae bacterium]MDD9955279.1 sugar ABC transporter permease [Anaerolineaceae bacterium]MDE0330186.1 sugar ABC transporter permease [Anaerolineaceae bacterium]
MSLVSARSGTSRSLLRLSLSSRQSEALTGILMASPWILGFLIFIVGPMLVSLYLSFTRWDLFTEPRWIGLRNYEQLFLRDAKFLLSLKVTTIYAFVSVPLQVSLGLVLANLLNQKIRLLGFFRTVYYLPSVIGGIAVAVMFRWIFGTQFGLINGMLATLGIQGPSWLGDPDLVLVSFVLMSMWGAGASMLIYLGALQGIPTELYEAADVDGAGNLARFLRITVPMMTPVIFFNMIMGIITALQEFVLPFIMTRGGPANSSTFLVLYLYRNAFELFKMGYASAIAWIIFIYIMVLTIFIIRSSSMWVYYEGSLKGR